MARKRKSRKTGGMTMFSGGAAKRFQSKTAGGTKATSSTGKYFTKKRSATPRKRKKR